MLLWQTPCQPSDDTITIGAVQTYNGLLSVI